MSNESCGMPYCQAPDLALQGASELCRQIFWSCGILGSFPWPIAWGLLGLCCRHHASVAIHTWWYKYQYCFSWELPQVSLRHTLFNLLLESKLVLCQSAMWCGQTNLLSYDTPGNTSIFGWIGRDVPLDYALWAFLSNKI